MKNEMCTSSERKFIVMSPVSGKAVQNWSFAGRPHIQFCSNPEWALKSPDEEGARDTLETLQKHFPGQKLVVVPVTFKTIVEIG